MEVEFLTKAEWTETINTLFAHLAELEQILGYISTCFYLLLFFGSGILLFKLMYYVLEKFM